MPIAGHPTRKPFVFCESTETVLRSEYTVTPVKPWGNKLHHNPVTPGDCCPVCQEAKCMFSCCYRDDIFQTYRKPLSPTTTPPPRSDHPRLQRYHLFWVRQKHLHYPISYGHYALHLAGLLLHHLNNNLLITFSSRAANMHFPLKTAETFSNFWLLYHFTAFVSPHTVIVLS